MNTFIASLLTLKLVSLKFFNLNLRYSNKSFELLVSKLLDSIKLLINSYASFFSSHLLLNKFSTIFFPRIDLILSNLGSSLYLFLFSFSLFSSFSSS